MFSLKINKRRGRNKVRGGRKKIETLISGEGLSLLGTWEYVLSESVAEIYMYVWPFSGYQALIG